MNFHPGAQRLVAQTLSDSIMPVAPLPFRHWLPKNIVLVDGPKKGEFWSEADAPYLGPIADALDIDHPANLVTVRKSQQTGVSILALAWALYIAEVAPDNILYAVPGLDMLQDINGKKLQPLIDAWQSKTRKEIILPTVSRSGGGSTIYEKRFAGGSISLANANSVNDLSGDTMRYGVKDEVSKWNNTPNGDDPEHLFFGRFTAFRRLKQWKMFELSTPEIDTGDELGEEPGHCRVDRSFIRSDQQFWHIECPECSHWFYQSESGFVIDRAHPHKSTYECPNCEHHLSEMERVFGVRAGKFIATAHGEGRHPGFHVDAFISLMMSYEAIAEDWLRQGQKGEEGAKGFTNLVLGLPYEVKGNAPDWQRLYERREDYKQGVIPAEGLLFVAAADVHRDNIMVEAVAFAEDRQSWSITTEFLEGPTDNINEGAWAKLDEFWRQSFVDVFGQERKIEALAVDSGDGLRTNQVTTWCAGRPMAHAIKGMPGRGVAAIGLPKKVSIKKNGKRQRVGAAKVWPVGTWTLKGELTGNLHKLGLQSGEAVDPPGFCHFGQWNNQEYFKQMTAEYFESKLVKGRLKEGWDKRRRANHWFDVRVYAMAMAELLGLSKLSKDGWAKLRARIVPTENIDLLSTESQKIADASMGETSMDPAEKQTVESQTKPTEPAAMTLAEKLKNR